MILSILTPAVPSRMAQLAMLCDELARLSIDDVIARGLHEFLEMAQAVIGRLASHVYDTYMHHPPVDMASEIRFHQQEQQQQQQQRSL